jgi:hypothetical protein
MADHDPVMKVTPPTYERGDPVKLLIDAARARRPRMYPSAIEEAGSMTSTGVANGDWTQGPDGPLDSFGDDPVQHLERLIVGPPARPHWLVPAEVEDVLDEVWTSGNLTLQGNRHRTLAASLGDAKATAIMKEEATLYGTSFGSKTPGVAPNSKEAKEAANKKPVENLSTNPWSASFSGTEEQRATRIAGVIKAGGTKFADQLARAAKTTVGKPLRK